MSNSVVAIGLDAANPELMEKWINKGLLPNLAKLKEKGSFGKLESSINHHRAEVAWPVFLSGCLSSKTGYWGPVEFDSEEYTFTDPGYEKGGYDFKEYPPFYAGLGKEFPVAVFDMPQTVLREDVSGAQVLGWGGHARMTPQQSLPEGLVSELIQKHGENPLLDTDSITEAKEGDFERFMSGVELGIKRKADIVKDLLERQKWSLMLTIFGEAHSAQHYLWHKSQPHTVNWSDKPPKNDPLLKTFQLMDAAIGEIVAAAGEDANIVVFSIHGTCSNTGDLGANVFLPEMLYRWNFPGKYAIGPGEISNLPMPKPRMATESSWFAEVWQLRYEPNKVKFLARHRVPFQLYHKLRLERLTGKESETALDYKPPLFWLPASWYSSHWKSMKAFALPSYSDGYIRINVEGRDKHGVVKPEDYDAVCDEVIEMLLEVRDGRKGERLITDVVRTRKSPFDSNRQSSDADIVVIFDERDCPADVVIHPTLGQIGPVPFNRSGGHYSAGFMLASGPDVPQGGGIHGDVIGVGPTILSMMGAPVPEHMDGKPLVID